MAKDTNQKQFTVIGHLEIPGLLEGDTRKFRVKIPAESQQEAEDKFKAFLLRKMVPVVDSCAPTDYFEEIENMFKGIFKNL